MPIYTSQIKGLVAGIAVKVNTATSESTGQWIKVARVSTQTDYDTSQSVFLFTFPGLDMYTNHRYRNEFILIARYTPNNSAPYIDSDGTMLELSSINSNELNGFDPSTDIALLYNSENGDGGAEIWIKIPDRRVNVMVTPLSATVETGSGLDFNNLGFEIIDGATTTNNFQGALPAEHIRNAADDADVDYGTVNGSWNDKIVGSLTLADNVIKASDGGTAITLDTSSNVTLSAKLRVPQYIEHNGDTDTRINFSAADQMTLEAGGRTMITLTEDGTQDEVVINDAQEDIDFRVEGNGVSHALFVEAATDRVAIGNSDPSTTLHVTGNTTLDGTTTASDNIVLHKAVNGGDPKIAIGSSGSEVLEITSNLYASNQTLVSADFVTKTASSTADYGKFTFSVDQSLIATIDDGGIVLAAGKSFEGNLTGTVDNATTAATATQVTVTANNTADETVYLTFVDGTTGAQGIETDFALNYNPSSNTLTAANFAGSLAGTATTATTVTTTSTSTDAEHYITFVDTGTSSASENMRFDTGLTYNPHSNFLTLAGDLRVGGSSIFGPADDFLALHSDTDMYFDIDEDADSTSLFHFRTGNTNVMTLNEAGTMSLTRIAGLGSALYIQKADGVQCPQIRFDNDDKLRLMTQGNSDASMYYGITLHAQEAATGPYIGYRNDSPIVPHTFSGDAAFSGRIHLGGTIDPGPINTLAISLSMADTDNGILLYRNDATTVAGNVLGGIGFDSTDGNLPSNTWEASAAIIAYAAETHGTGDKGGYLTFRTAPIDQDDDTSSIERFRIEPDGKVYVLGANAYSSAASGDGTLILVQNADSVDDGFVIYNTALTRAFRFWVGSDNESNIYAGSSGNQPINISARPLRLLNGTDVSGTADSGFLILGDTAGTHMSIDSNEIQVKKATNDPAGTRLYLQALGGDVFIHRPSSDPGTALHVVNEDEEDSILPTCYIQSNASDGANDSVILGLNYATIAATGADSGDVHIDFQVNETSQGQIYASGTTVVYSAFTGVHISGIDPSRKEEFMTKGLIVSSDGSKRLEHVSEAVTGCKISSHAKDKAVYGVVSRTPFDPTISKWAGFVEGDLAIHVNSVGNGMVWVTDITGNIECGDFICSSDIAGYGQLQDDDILRNYTVAKCTESVDWSQISETIDHDGQTFKKCLIACTYHCG